MSHRRTFAGLFAAQRPVKFTLHLEGAAVAVVCSALYGHLGGSWWVFAALLLIPDVVMLGYLAGPRIGALIYNVGHSYVTPIILAGGGATIDLKQATLLSLIWGTHIGMDRALGYGLKYAEGFKVTHFDRL